MNPTVIKKFFILNETNKMNVSLADARMSNNLISELQKLYDDALLREKKYIEWIKTSLHNMKLAELRKLTKEFNIVGTSRMSKNDLRDRIKREFS